MDDGWEIVENLYFGNGDVGVDGENFSLNETNKMQTQILLAISRDPKYGASVTGSSSYTLV